MSATHRSRSLHQRATFLVLGLVVGFLVYMAARGTTSGSDATPKRAAPGRGRIVDLGRSVPEDDGVRGGGNEVRPSSGPKLAQRSPLATESSAAAPGAAPTAPLPFVVPATPQQREAFVLAAIEPRFQLMLTICYRDLRDKYLASIRGDLDPTSRAQALRLVQDLVDREFEFRIEANRCLADYVRSAPNLSCGKVEIASGHGGVIELGVVPGELWGLGRNVRVEYMLSYETYPELKRAKDSVRQAKAACQVFF